MAGLSFEGPVRAHDRHRLLVLDSTGDSGERSGVAGDAFFSAPWESPRRHVGRGEKSKLGRNKRRGGERTSFRRPVDGARVHPPALS
jgi:hypothetical protein